jgi:hypothetical protein
LNILDNVIFSESLGSENDRRVTLKFNPKFRGCGNMLLEKVATYKDLIIRRSSSTSLNNDDVDVVDDSSSPNADCDWSNMRGGWKLDGKVPLEYIVEKGNRCKIPNFNPDFKGKDPVYFGSFPPRPRPSTIGGKLKIITSSSSSSSFNTPPLFDHSVCIIGDSNTRNPWKDYVLLTPTVSQIKDHTSDRSSVTKKFTTANGGGGGGGGGGEKKNSFSEQDFYFPRIDVFCEGGGVDIDLISGKRFSNEMPHHSQGLPLRNNEVEN